MQRRNSKLLRRAGWALGLLAALGASLVWFRASRLPELAMKSSGTSEFPDDTYNPPIRVSLTSGTAHSLELGCRGRLEIRLVGSTEVIWQGEKLPEARVTCSANGVRIGELSLPATRVELVPEMDSGIRVNGHEYRGTVQLYRMRTGRLLTVNVLPLEQYLASVVDSEMPIEFGVEARRAQSIAARTYALYQMQEHSEHPYFDVYATTRSQRYLGKEYPGPKGVMWAGESAQSREIVRDTRGVVCISNGSIFCTYFSSVCGGATSVGSDLFSDADPLLQRVPCPYCQEADMCRWQREIAFEDLLQRVNRHASTKFGGSTSLTDQSASVENSRPIDEIVFRDGEASVTLTHWELRQYVLGSRLPSPLFVLERQGNQVVFHGRGHGHCAGFCQWGARGQDRAGRSFRQILEHYYPGCELVRIVAQPSEPR